MIPTKLNYIVTEKDFLAVVYSINKFCHYIKGYDFFVHIDHSTIIFFMNKPITNGRVTRWLLLLQEFNIIVVDLPSRENLVADFLSCIQHDDGVEPVDDTFPDKHLFVVSVQTPWFAGIANYLATRKLPNHLSPHEKHCIIGHSSNYSWVDNDLFHNGPDLIIRRCVREDEMTEILRACHDGPCGDTFLTSGRHTKYCILVITVQALLRMLLDLLKDVIVSKEWVELRHLTRFLYSLRSRLNLLRSGLLIL